MRPHILVDESKHDCYRVIAAVIDLPSKVLANQSFRDLPKGRSASRMGRRDQQRIVQNLPKLPVPVELFESHARDEREARARCIRAVARRAIELHATEIVIEPDASFVESDLMHLRLLLAGTDIKFRHATVRSAPLLCIADAVGWAWHRDHYRRRAIRKMVRAVHKVDEVRSPPYRDHPGTVHRQRSRRMVANVRTSPRLAGVSPVQP